MKDIVVRLNELKKILKDKRKKSLVILVMYAIFFALIFLAIQLGTTPNYKLTGVLEDFRALNNYNYSYTIAKDDDVEVVYGKRFEEKRQLIYGNEVFNFESGKLIGFPIAEIDISKLEFNNIYLLISMGEQTFKDNMMEVYELPLSRFIKFMNNVNITSDEVVIIRVIYPGGNLSQIDLDLTNYVNYNQPKFESYSISINYNNIGNVIDF